MPLQLQKNATLNGYREYGLKSKQANRLHRLLLRYTPNAESQQERRTKTQGI